MTPLPAARAASTPPAGIATGKFQGGVTTVRRDGSNRAPSTAGSRSSSVGVVMREVDRLAHLGVGLGERLAGLGHHHGDEVAASRRQGTAGLVQRPRANLRRPREPGAATVAHGGDQRLQAGRPQQPVELDGVLAERRVLRTVCDALGPVTVGRDRRIGVWGVGEALVARRDLSASGLGCASVAGSAARPTTQCVA